MGPSPYPRDKMSKHGVETSCFTTKEEVQKSPLCQKILLTFFWGMKRAILEHYQAKGQTVN